MSIRIILFASFLTVISQNILAQNAGEVMFVGFNADGNDGFAFVTLVPLVDGTTIFVNDNEWNENPIGSGGAFNTGEGFVTWTNDTGATISAGEVITINNTSAGTITSSLGTATESGNFNLASDDEVLYMFLGSDGSTPTTFLSAITNDDFNDSADGRIVNTGLTEGVNAVGRGSGAVDEDVMVYSGHLVCDDPTLVACSTQIADPDNWTTQDGSGDQSNDATAPDFPGDVTTNLYGRVFEPVTYYTRNATIGGAWDDPNSWTTISDGSGGPLPAGMWPGSSDNIVILDGHRITVNDIADNRGQGIRPTGLGLINSLDARTNIGGFSNSGNAHFYHTGDVTIDDGGTFNSFVRVMVEGYTRIEGTYNSNSDFVNLGSLEITPTGGFTATVDDIFLSGNSETIINADISHLDDLSIDHTDATLCGTGSWTMNGTGGTGGNQAALLFLNSATSDQVCSDISITCTTNCSANVPFTGTGMILFGNTGPGGVGFTNGMSNLEFWLRADAEVFEDAGSDLAETTDAVQQWNDQSGYGRNITQATAGDRPSYITGALNSQPVIRFDAASTQWLGPVRFDAYQNNYSIFLVGFTSAGSQDFLAVSSGASHGILIEAGTLNRLRFLHRSPLGGSGGTSLLGGSTLDYANSQIYSISRGTPTTGAHQFWINGGDNTSTPAGDVNFTVSNMDLVLGRLSVTLDMRYLNGDMAEVILYSAEINRAQRTIIQNYLAAKYDIAVSDDFYDGDASGFDFEVAGIGQAPGNSNHTDAKGPGAVRMWNPSDLDNGDYLIWGHDNAPYAGTTTDVDGTLVEERIERVWFVTETNEVGTVSISFDLSNLASPLGSNLRLLIDRDGDGFSDNDVTPIVGSASGSLITFSGIDLQDGDRITIGNVDETVPLPIELNYFSADVENRNVVTQWSTSSEINNDYFTVERSIDAKIWQSIGTVEGAGSSEELLNYQYVDREPIAGRSFYRLKQTDFDGKYEYSRVVSVEVDKQFELRAFPNPSEDLFTLSTGFDLNSEQIEVIDVLGKQMTKRTSKEGLDLILDASNYPEGLYIVKVVGKDGNHSIRIMKE